MEIRVLIVNNNPLENNAFRDFAKFMPGITVIGTATGETEGLRLLGSERPDGLILNTVLDEGTGFNVLMEAGRMEPRPFVVVLTEMAGADDNNIPWSQFGFSYSRQNPACGPEAIFNLFLNTFRQRTTEEDPLRRDFFLSEEARISAALRTMDACQRQLWCLLTMARLTKLVQDFFYRTGRMEIFPDILKYCRDMLFSGGDPHTELLWKYIRLSDEARLYCLQPDMNCGLSEGKFLDLGNIFFGLKSYLKTFFPGRTIKMVQTFRLVGAGRLCNFNKEWYQTSDLRQCPLFMEETRRMWQDYGLIVSRRQDKRSMLLSRLRGYEKLDIREEPEKPQKSRAGRKKK